MRHDTVVITAAALLTATVNLDGIGDIVAVLSGCNVEEKQYRDRIA